MVTVVDICLVNMPYGNIAYPSPAMGLLQAALERDGFRVKSIYANLLFAEEISLDKMKLLARTGKEDQIGEWTFSHTLFDGDPKGDRPWLDRFFGHDSKLADDHRKKLEICFYKVRKQAGKFIDSLANIILDLNPKIVGCSSSFQQHTASLALLKKLRALSPEITTIMGGANCATIMGKATHHHFPWVDYVVSGEGETLLPSLVKMIIQGKEDCRLPNAIPTGVFAPIHRTAGYPVTEAGQPYALAGQDWARPLPNYDDYFNTVSRLTELKKYIIPVLPMETSRGCWWAQNRPCKFCSINGPETRFRSKSATRVFRELETLSDRYGITSFAMMDTVMDQDYYQTLLPALKRHDRPYTLYLTVRVDVRPENIKTLKDAGVTWVQPGIESLDSRILSLVNKGTRAWQNIVFLKDCRQFGIRAIWNMMYGFPDVSDAWFYGNGRAHPAACSPGTTHGDAPALLCPRCPLPEAFQ